MLISIPNSQGKNYQKNNPEYDYRVKYHDQTITVELSDEELAECHFYENANHWVMILGTISYSNLHINNPKDVAIVYASEYITSPDSFLNLCDGNFLVAAYDKQKRKLTMLRDALGLKHVYYSSTSDGFCISTSLRLLLQIKKSKKVEISLEALNHYLTFQYIPQPYTMFIDIHQVPLQSTVTYENGNCVVKSFNITINQFLDNHISSTNSSLKTLLINSFNRQLTSQQTKVGAFLSGGMDTSGNVAILAEFLGIKPITFTAAFHEAEYDETPYAKIMAKHYTLEHHVVIVTSKIIEHVSTISGLYDNPIADRAILPEYIICKMAQEMGINYMVSGEGGDEILGYPRNLPENVMFSKELYANDKLLAEYYYSYSALIQKDHRNKLLQTSVNNHEDYLANFYKTLGKIHPFEKIYYGQWQTWLIDNVLMKDTQLFKNSSLKFVSPYIDVELMKHIATLDVDEKMIKLCNKNYLKEELHDILPDKIIHKKKHKFKVPISEWIRENSYSLFHEKLLANNSLVNGYMDQKLVLSMLEDHKKGKHDYNRPLWALYFLENWYTSINQLS